MDDFQGRVGLLGIGLGLGLGGIFGSSDWFRWNFEIWV